MGPYEYLSSVATDALTGSDIAASVPLVASPTIAQIHTLIGTDLSTTVTVEQPFPISNGTRELIRLGAGFESALTFTAPLRKDGAGQV